MPVPGGSEMWQMIESSRRQDVAMASCAAGRGGPDCTVSRDLIPALRGVDPYASLQLRPLQLTGWSFTSKRTYSGMVDLANASVIVEVGVWRGLSASLLAAALRRRRRGGVLFAVDTWLGAVEFWNRRYTGGDADQNRDLELRHGYPSAYLTFLSNMVHMNVSSYVTPLPMTSRTAAELLRDAHVRPDLIHLDAAHEYMDIKEDINLWLPLLSPCGVLLGDDYMPAWPGVMRAVDELAQMPQLHVVRPEPGDKVLGVKWYARRRRCMPAPQRWAPSPGKYGW